MRLWQTSIALHSDGPRLFLPIKDQLRERGVVEGNHIEWNSLINDHASEEKLCRLGQIQSDPAQYMFACEFNFGSNTHLKHGAANNTAHTSEYIEGSPHPLIAAYWSCNTL